MLVTVQEAYLLWSLINEGPHLFGYQEHREGEKQKEKQGSQLIEPHAQRKCDQQPRETILLIPQGATLSL